MVNLQPMKRCGRCGPNTACETSLYASGRCGPPARGSSSRSTASPPAASCTVTRIDRQARGTFDLFAIVKRIVDAKAQFRSLAEPWADTGSSTGRLMLPILGGLADVEHDLIRTRTAEGRARQGPRKPSTANLSSFASMLSVT